MYIILLHVSGISLLEILFYFEYIGHVESQLFKNSIIRILNEPYNEEHKYIIFTPNITFADNQYSLFFCVTISTDRRDVFFLILAFIKEFYEAIL